MFGPCEADPDPARRTRQKQYENSILDVVLTDAQRLSSTLGGSDKRKLDEYLTSVREVEKRVQKARGEKDRATPETKLALKRPDNGLPEDIRDGGGGATVQETKPLWDMPALFLAIVMLVSAEWGLSENNRRARYYALTSAGRRQLKAEEAAWRRYAEAVFKVPEPA